MVCRFLKVFLFQSSIHGLGHLCRRSTHTIEKIFWCLMIGMGIYGTVVLSRMTSNRYEENPTVISMERDRFAWNTSFPAITICPSKKLSENSLEEYVRATNVRNKTAFKKFLISLSTAVYDTFEKVEHYDDLHAESYMSTLLELGFKLSPSVTNSGISKSFTLQKSITEMGICYTVNSMLALYNSPE